MIPLIILAGAAIAGTAVIASYWKEIKSWLSRIYDRLPEVVKKYLKGALSFVKRIGATALNIMKYYSYNEDTKKWNETVVTTEVDESTVPDKFREMVNYQRKNEVETTEELELALSS